MARYTSPSAALAAGYVPVSPTNYPVVYYVNPTIVAANAAAGRTLDPQSVDGLVFAQTPSGQEVLAAAMYILPSTVTPTHALRRLGPVAPTHRRLWPEHRVRSHPLQITGAPPCPAGSVQQSTPFMTMVWQVPVAGGPLAIQPPDIQIVEAAVMSAGT